MRRDALRMGLSFAALAATVLAAGCGQGDGQGDPGGNRTGATAEAVTSSVIKHVFVIAMENHDATQIYGNTKAPYINNTLIPDYAHASNFNDALALSIPSEPHYVWMEAGTNAFSDHTFTSDSDPSTSNSTSSTSHLATQIKNATNGVTWRTLPGRHQLDDRHLPDPLSRLLRGQARPVRLLPGRLGQPAVGDQRVLRGRTTTRTARSRPTSRPATSRASPSSRPNLCHDMHGASGCPDANLSRRATLAQHRAPAHHHLRERERRRHLRRLGRRRPRSSCRSSRSAPA